MKTISRKDAKVKGMKRYFTGAVCKNGHVAERFVCNYECVKCDAIRKKTRKSVNAAKDVKAATLDLRVVGKVFVKKSVVKPTKKVRVVEFKYMKRNVVGNRRRFSPEVTRDEVISVAV